MPYKYRGSSVGKLIGVNLKRYRRDANLTAREIADMMGIVSASTIFNWETGFSNMSLDNLYSYCCILGIHPEKVLPPYKDYKPKFKMQKQ